MWFVVRFGKECASDFALPLRIQRAVESYQQQLEASNKGDFILG